MSPYKEAASKQLGGGGKCKTETDDKLKDI